VDEQSRVAHGVAQDAPKQPSESIDLDALAQTLLALPKEERGKLLTKLLGQ
jgi:hypothetical protein